MLCPVCNTELRPTDRQGVEIDVCPKCRGVWLDRGELEKLIEREGSAAMAYQTPTPGYYGQPPVQPYNYGPDPGYRGRDRDDDDDDDDDYKRNRRGKKKGFLGDMFDF
jgi:uncharacterized protein